MKKKKKEIKKFIKAEMSQPDFADFQITVGDQQFLLNAGSWKHALKIIWYILHMLPDIVEMRIDTMKHNFQGNC